MYITRSTCSLLNVQFNDIPISSRVLLVGTTRLSWLSMSHRQTLPRALEGSMAYRKRGLIRCCVCVCVCVCVCACVCVCVHVRVCVCVCV